MPELAWPILCAICTAVLVAGEIWKWSWIRAISKTGGVIAFLMYALTRGAWEAGDAGKVGVIALIFCGIGDLCLLSRGRLPFGVGIVAFLLGHLGYIGMFWLLGFDVVPALVGALPIGVFGAFVWGWVRPRVGVLGPAVAIYILVICAMVAVSIGVATAGRPILLLAAVIFFLSDLCVARDRFVVSEWRNRALGLPLYFGAQIVFAYGMTL